MSFIVYRSSSAFADYLFDVDTIERLLEHRGAEPGAVAHQKSWSFGEDYFEVPPPGEYIRYEPIELNDDSCRFLYHLLSAEHAIVDDEGGPIPALIADPALVPHLRDHPKGYTVVHDWKELKAALDA